MPHHDLEEAATCVWPNLDAGAEVTHHCATVARLIGYTTRLAGPQARLAETTMANRPVRGGGQRRGEVIVGARGKMVLMGSDQLVW
jgi:hypothetical protein